MSKGPRVPSAKWHPGVFVCCLYAVELWLVLAFVALYKKGDRTLAAFANSRSGVFVILAVAGFAVTSAVAVLAARRGRLRPRWISTMSLLNVLSLSIAFVTAEVAIRVLSVDSVEGPRFAGTLLLPREWERIAMVTRATLARASATVSYLVFDPELGWTVGASRHSGPYNRQVAQSLSAPLERATQNVFMREQRATIARDTLLYISNGAGLRSPSVGTNFADTRARHRIALVGDSFTFGLEVRYEDTWGHRLEMAMGPEYQVLNFGVDGFGVDQAVRRYERDVVQWKPDIVVLSVINSDLRRTMCVYGFLCFAGAAIPFPKPRLVLAGDTLVQLNAPLPRPESLLVRTHAASELPFIAFDASYDPAEWDRRFLDHSFVLRLLFSRERPWTRIRPEISDAALQDVNGLLFRSFMARVRARGSIPIVVFFPSMNDFLSESQGRRSVAKDVLRRHHVPFIDMTECVSRIDSRTRFVVLHYSAATNAAVARCLHERLVALPRDQAH